MKKEYIFLVGIPASGKSTFAEDFISKNSDFIRWNRDSIREMMMPNHKYKWYEKENRKEKNDKESIITKMYYNLIRQEINIIDDNINIDPYFFLYQLDKVILEGYNVSIAILTDSYDLETCIDRNNLRTINKVAVSYIEKMHQSFIKIIEEVKKINNIKIIKI